MRHRHDRLRLNQKPDHARLLKRNLVTSLLLYEAIRTTRKRARVIQPIVDTLITTAKKKSPHIAIRSINAYVTDKNASRKLMEVLKERYVGRTSGFTRITPVGSRKGDGAELVDMILLDAPVAVAAPEPKAKTKKAAKPAKKAPTESSEPTAQS